MTAKTEDSSQKSIRSYIKNVVFENMSQQTDMKFIFFIQRNMFHWNFKRNCQYNMPTLLDVLRYSDIGSTKISEIIRHVAHIK